MSIANEVDTAVRPSTGAKFGSFDEMYRRHQPELVRYAARRGATDPEGVADLAILDTYHAQDRIRSDHERVHWAYLYRAVDSHVARERRKPVAAPVCDESALDDVETFEDSLVAQLDIEDVLANLPATQREVLRLRFLTDLTSAEAGAVLGKSPDAVRQIQRRGLRRLRRLLYVAAIVAVVVAAALLTQLDPATMVDQEPVTPDRGRAPVETTTTSSDVVGPLPTPGDVETRAVPQSTAEEATPAEAPLVDSTTSTATAGSTPAPRATSPRPSSTVTSTRPGSSVTSTRPTVTVTSTRPPSTVATTTTTRRQQQQQPAGTTLVSAQSGLCLTPERVGYVNNAYLVQIACDGSDDQRWEIRNVDGGLVQLFNLGTGLCVHVENFSYTHGAPFLQTYCNLGANAVFDASTVDGGYVFEVQHTNFCLEVSFARAVEGQRIVQGGCADASHQIFRPVR